MVIKRIGPVSCAKITGTLYAILGIVVGAIFSLASLPMAVTASASQRLPVESDQQVLIKL
jgi:hypothetical protein